MVRVGNIVEISSPTKREKELIRSHDSRWLVSRVERVQCFDGHIGCLLKTIDSKHSRWIEAERLRVKNHD